MFLIYCINRLYVRYVEKEPLVLFHLPNKNVKFLSYSEIVMKSNDVYSKINTTNRLSIK